MSPSSLSIPVPSELLWRNMEPIFCSPLSGLSPDDTNTTIEGKILLSASSFPMSTSLFLSPLSHALQDAGRTEKAGWRANILKTKLFENDVDTIIIIFPRRDFLKQKSKMTGDCCVFKFLRCSVDGA